MQAVVRLVVVVSGAFAVALQVRTLTVADYGVFVTILSIITLLSAFTDVGLTNTAVQRIARDPLRQRVVAGGLLIARTTLGFLLALIGAVVALSLFRTSADRLSAALMIASIPLATMTALQAISIARLRLMQQNLLLATQGLFWLVIVIVLSATGADLVMFAAGFLLSAVLQGSLVWAILGRKGNVDFRLGVREVPSLMRQAIPLGLGGIGTTAYYRLSGVILFATAGPVAAASYAAAFKVVDMLQAIPASLLAPLIPLLSRALESNDARRVDRLWDLASRLALSVSMMVSVGVAVTAPQIVTLLFGSAYADSVDLLQVVVLGFIPICLGWVATGALTAAGRVKGYAVVTLSVATGSVAAGLILMPRFGAAAAAAISFVTEMLVATGLLWVLWRETQLRIRTSVWARAALAASLMGTAVWFVKPPFADWILLLVQIGVGIVVASAALFLLRVITIHDIRAVFSKSDIMENRV
ncbi:oligosaccharide flippase family protein [Mycolicibacterium neoaurum]|nr:oligosaccharide flippase family protein [Mycolicibacterium neoaurum]TLH59055.1 hypothetical protein C1S81_13315 [Mycolicibacterium neoaurum]